jgi:hypothetical protein
MGSINVLESYNSYFELTTGKSDCQFRRIIHTYTQNQRPNFTGKTKRAESSADVQRLQQLKH